MISSMTQVAVLSAAFLLPLISCCLKAQSGSCFACVHIETLVGTCTSLKCPDLLFHEASGWSSSVRTSWNRVSLCLEWSFLGHVVNSWLVGIRGEATSCVNRRVLVFTCKSWITSLLRTTRPRPASGRALVGRICQWLFVSLWPYPVTCWPAGVYTTLEPSRTTYSKKKLTLTTDTPILVRKRISFDMGVQVNFGLFMSHDDSVVIADFWEIMITLPTESG